MRHSGFCLFLNAVINKIFISLISHDARHIRKKKKNLSVIK